LVVVLQVLFLVGLISSAWSLPCSFQVPGLLLLDACPAPPGCSACFLWLASTSSLLDLIPRFFYVTMMAMVLVLLVFEFDLLNN
jgi:hypothetical protein